MLVTIAFFVFCMREEIEPFIIAKVLSKVVTYAYLLTKCVHFLILGAIDILCLVH